MAEVTVFVDDAVRGRLPLLCVKEGVPTGDRLTMDNEVAGGAGLGVAWLLLLAGPLGWLGLLVIAGLRRPTDHLRVTLPFSEFAHRRLGVARRMHTVWTVALVASSLLAVLAVAMERTATVAAAIALGAFAVAALVQVIITARRVSLYRVGVALDASRRWVTLSGVHPVFAAAVREQLAHQDETARPR